MSFTRQGLIFREVEPTDLPLLRQWRNDEHMAQGWHDPVSIQTPHAQSDWYRSLDRSNQAFIAMDKQLTVGLLRFRLDHANRRAALTGTDVAPDSQGAGYGKRILRAGAEHVLITLGMHRVTAEALATNVAAIHIIQAAGFKPEGMYRQYVWRNGKWQDWHFFSLLEGEI